MVCKPHQRQHRVHAYVGLCASLAVLVTSQARAQEARSSKIDGEVRSVPSEKYSNCYPDGSCEFAISVDPLNHPDAIVVSGACLGDEDENGIDDLCEGGFPAAFPPGCLPDLNGDGVVGAADLAILLGGWGPCLDCDDCPGDLDGDCIVSAADLAILLAGWGLCPDVPGLCPSDASGSCCEGHPWGGCGHPECCEAVCAIEPACCDIWAEMPCMFIAFDACIEWLPEACPP